MPSDVASLGRVFYLNNVKMQENEVFITVEEYLEKNSIQHNSLLVNSIKKYLNRKINRDRLSYAGVRDGDMFLARYFDTRDVKDKINQLIEDNQSLAKKYTL